MRRHEDPHDLQRFVDAQASDYERALSELRNGRKQTHWMWYVFPQFDGLGMSATSREYAIRSSAEAGAYLAHPVLGPRLVACCETILAIHRRSALEVFGSPDNLKLQSCATLFDAVSPTGTVYERVINRFFEGERCRRTLQLLEAQEMGRGRSAGT